MLRIALPALVSAKTAIAVDHSGGLLDLTTDTATEEIYAYSNSRLEDLERFYSNL